MATPTAPIDKTIAPAFALIDSLNKTRKYKVSVGNVATHPFSGRSLDLKKNNNGYQFKTVTLVRRGVQSYKEFEIRRTTELKLSNSKLNLFLQGSDVLINNISYPNFSDPNAVPTKLVRGEFTSLSTRKNIFFDAPHFYRVVLPVPEDFTLLHHFTGERYTVASKFRLAPLMRLAISGVEYHCFTMSDEQKKNYFILDCCSKTNFRSFLRVFNSLLLAYALLKGKYEGFEAYIFPYGSSKFDQPQGVKTCQLVGGDKGFPIHITNPYNIEQIAAKINYKTDKNGKSSLNDRHLNKYRIAFPHIIFGKLCELISSNYGILRGAILFVNNKSIGLELRIPALYVAIENITRVLSGNNVATPRIITDAKIEAALKTAIKSSVKLINEIERLHLPATSSQEDQKEYKANFARMTGKLHGLNMGSNNKKLTDTFTNVGYTLTAEEDELLNRKRNVFLHGEDFMSLQDEDDTEFKELFYISLKLQKLIAILLLKKSGYSGYILNNAKVHERITGRKIAEPYFIKI